MSTFTDLSPAITVDRPVTTSSADRARRRAIRVLTVISIISVAMTVYLVARGHTAGEQIWGPVTTTLAATTGLLSLAFLAHRGRTRALRLALIGLWLTVAFLGFGGYQSHRLAFSGNAGDARQGPPIAPLMFLGFGIAGTVSVRAGSKGD